MKVVIEEIVRRLHLLPEFPGSRFGTAHTANDENYAPLRVPPIGLKPNYKHFQFRAWERGKTAHILIRSMLY